MTGWMMWRQCLWTAQAFRTWVMSKAQSKRPSSAGGNRVEEKSKLQFSRLKVRFQCQPGSAAQYAHFSSQTRQSLYFIHRGSRRMQYNRAADEHEPSFTQRSQILIFQPDCSRVLSTATQSIHALSCLAYVPKQISPLPYLRNMTHNFTHKLALPLSHLTNYLTNPYHVPHNRSAWLQQKPLVSSCWTMSGREQQPMKPDESWPLVACLKGRRPWHSVFKHL
jgi:hypothetical protein